MAVQCFGLGEIEEKYRRSSAKLLSFRSDRLAFNSDEWEIYGKNNRFSGGTGYFKRLKDDHYHMFRKLLVQNADYKDMDTDAQNDVRSKLTSAINNRLACIGFPTANNGYRSNSFNSTPWLVDSESNAAEAAERREENEKIEHLRDHLFSTGIFEVDSDGNPVYPEKGDLPRFYKYIIEQPQKHESLPP